MQALGPDAVKCVIVPYENYEELFRRSLTAPKQRPALTGKQKAKFNDHMAEAAVVMVQRKEMSVLPTEVSEMVERETMK